VNISATLSSGDFIVLNHPHHAAQHNIFGEIAGKTGPRRSCIATGDSSIENLKTLAHVGATHFISKPFKGETLVERLNELGVANESGTKAQRHEDMK
jgi:hypothetical protein